MEVYLHTVQHAESGGSSAYLRDLLCPRKLLCEDTDAVFVLLALIITQTVEPQIFQKGKYKARESITPLISCGVRFRDTGI